MKRGPLEVLLADDNDNDIMIIQMLLAEAGGGHSINFVRSSDDVVKYLRREGAWKDAPRPSVVLLDLNMPKRDGLEVLKEIKSDSKLCEIPVVILSSSDDRTQIKKAFGHGASSFITKPVNFDHFRELMREFVRYWTYVTHVP